MVRMGRWCRGHHEKLNEVGKEGGWIIMKKQAPQDAVQSTCVLGSGGQEPQVVGGATVQGEVLTMHDGWRQMGRPRREVLKLVAKIGRHE
jgi:hypothetical protein